MQHLPIEIISGQDLRAGDKFLDDHGQVWTAKTCIGANREKQLREFFFVNEETGETSSEVIEDNCWLDRVTENTHGSN